MKPKLHLRAKHKITGQTADLYFYSIRQAKKFNPSFTDWQVKGVKHD